MECPLYIPPLGGALESYGVYLIYSPLHPTDSLLILCLVAGDITEAGCCNLQLFRLHCLLSSPSLSVFLPCSWSSVRCIHFYNFCYHADELTPYLVFLTSIYDFVFNFCILFFKLCVCMVPLCPRILEPMEALGTGSPWSWSHRQRQL